MGLIVSSARLQELLSRPTIKQDPTPGSEWMEARRWMVTGSDYAAVLGMSKYKTREQLMEDKLSGISDIPPWGTAATRFGTFFEPIARQRYAEATRNEVFELGLAKYPGEDAVGGSVDGITKDLTLIEIKCPFLRSVELEKKKFDEGRLPLLAKRRFEHWCQVQLYASIYNLDTIHYVQYRPEIWGASECLFVEAIEVDKVFIRNTLPVVKEFITEMNSKRKM